MLLKIKDDVDLDILYDYGFSKTIKKQRLLYVWQNKFSIDVVEINAKTKEITNLGDRCGNVVFYDLITAGLVEKVKNSEKI